MKKNYFLLLFILLISWLPSLAQTYKIQGSVIDKRTREPLEFVNVLVIGLNSGASTDSEGNFTIASNPQLSSSASFLRLNVLSSLN